MRARPKRIATPLLAGMVLVLTLTMTLTMTPLFAASGAFAAQSNTPVPVIVSIPPQAYLVARIGGAEVSIRTMTGQGRDPHAYEPTASQMADVSRAKIYFAIGVPFETMWLPKFKDLNPSLRVHDHLAGVARLSGRPDLALRGRAGERQASGAGHGGHGHAHGHDHNHGLETDDPHIWLSPKVMASLVPGIAQTLGEAAPEHAAIFNERAATLKKDILDLDARIAALFAQLPEERRTFLTFHQSWAYFADNYGLLEASVELEGREPGPKSMALLVDFAKKSNIRALVTDPMTPKSAASAIASSIGAAIVTATPLDENWPESMLRFSKALAAALATIPAR